jgi:sortase (surface protein transpeptidase)
LFVLATVLLVWGGASLVTAQSVQEVAPAPPSGRTVAASAPENDRAAKPLRRIPPPQPVRRAAPAPKYKVQAPKPNVGPESIEIPALDIDQDLTELAVIGTDLQVPDDYSDIGWWRGGLTPGEKGASVMVGHVDSPTGPAVFYQLSGLRPGHEVTVRLEDGSRAVFAVRRVQTYDRTKFPSNQVYRSQGKPGLNLLTCGGSFDADAGQYSSNVVVYTDLVKRIPAKTDKQGSARADKQQGSAKADKQQGPPKADKQQGPPKADKQQGPPKADRQPPAKADEKAPAQAEKQGPPQADKPRWYKRLVQDSRRRLAQEPERFEQLIQTRQQRLEDERGQRP